MAHSRGLDLSHHQAEPLSFHAMRASGLEFVGLKATEGKGYTDPTFAERRVRAHAVGFLKILIYHFVKPAAKVEAQAKHIAAVVGKLGPNEILVLDVEGDDWLGISPSDAASIVTRLVFHLKQAFGIKASDVMLYTSLSWARGVFRLELASLTFMPLWIARYRNGVDLGRPDPGDVSPWKSWTCWQYTQEGTAAGVRGDVDLNVWSSPLSK